MAAVAFVIAIATSVFAATIMEGLNLTNSSSPAAPATAGTPSIGETALYVLPSASGAASGAWSIEPWRILAADVALA
jgi:hypothetical protein